MVRLRSRKSQYLHDVGMLKVYRGGRYNRDPCPMLRTDASYLSARAKNPNADFNKTVIDLKSVHLHEK